MEKNDDRLLRPGDISQALQLLTRLPVPTDGHQRGAQAAWAYPVAGLVIGAVGACVGTVAHGLGLPAPLAALLVVLTLVMVTGGLHEDGLADTADGLWGGWTLERRLEIMKDSRIGSYGVLALVFSVGARWAALSALFELGSYAAATAVLVGSSVSRSMVPAVMALMENARQDGLSAQVGVVQPHTAGVSLVIGLVVAVVLSGWSFLAVLISAGLASLAMALVARAKIGGQTGDILGAVQQVSEIAVLFCLVTFI